MDTKDALDYLRMTMARDHDYAWVWHSNIAMATYDAGGDPRTANEGAARFMKLVFGVDTTVFPEYIDLMSLYA